MPTPFRLTLSPRARRILWAAVGFTVLLLLAEPAALWLVRSDRVVSRLLQVAYPVPTAVAGEGQGRVRVRIDGSRPIAEVSAEFLSVAVDTSQVVGGHWWSDAAGVELKKGQNRTQPFDFDRRRLEALASALAPAYLRIGGTEADDVAYEMAHDGANGSQEMTLTRSQMDAVGGFARRVGMKLFMTVNAGSYDREGGAWTGRRAKRLLQYAKEKQYPVGVWELGNEVNVYWFTKGLGEHVGPEQYAEDYDHFSRLVRDYFPDARVAAVGAFLWPVMSEPPPKMLPDLMRVVGSKLDILTWHYYPQQSRRCWSATRRAKTALLLEPHLLDEFGRTAEYLTTLRNEHAPDADLWLGETGGAQCGGEPGISDRFESSLWWMDQLGQAAQRGQPVVVRQTLAGSHYGLIDDETLEPRPDYWSSLLFKKLMGTRVLDAQSEGNDRVRIYAQCTPAVPGAPAGSATLLAVNLERTRPIDLAIEGDISDAKVYVATGETLSSKQIRLNDEILHATDEGPPHLESMAGDLEGEVLELPPSSFAFIVLPRTNAAACRSEAPTGSF